MDFFPIVAKMLMINKLFSFSNYQDHILRSILEIYDLQFSHFSSETINNESFTESGGKINNFVDDLNIYYGNTMKFVYSAFASV